MKKRAIIAALLISVLTGVVGNTTPVSATPKYVDTSKYEELDKVYSDYFRIGVAVQAIDHWNDPTAEISLTVPELLQDGSNYFFIPESGYTIGEKSPEKLYIPVQRTGNLDGEADVTVKIVDLSAHVGENYDVEILNELVLRQCYAIRNLSLSECLLCFISFKKWNLFRYVSCYDITVYVG